MAKKAPKKKAAKPVGRPTKFDIKMYELVTNYCLLGATDEELAKFLGLSVSTLNNYKRDYPEFLASIKAGREEADAMVGQRLYQRACGYSHQEDKVFCNNGEVTIVPTTKHYPPDTAAAFIWLKNRRGPNMNNAGIAWRDKIESEHTERHEHYVIEVPPDVPEKDWEEQVQVKH